MAEHLVSMEVIIGKTITDIRCKYSQQDGWLDTAACFIELDGQFYMEIPYGKSENAVMVELPPDAKTIFSNLADIPQYQVNPSGKSIAAIAAAHQRRRQSLFRVCLKNG